MQTEEIFHQFQNLTNAELILKAANRDGTSNTERAAIAQAILDDRRRADDATNQSKEAAQQRKFDAAQLEKQIESSERIARQQFETAEKQLTISERQATIAADQASLAKRAVDSADSSARASHSAKVAAWVLAGLTVAQILILIWNEFRPTIINIDGPVQVQQPVTVKQLPP